MRVLVIGSGFGGLAAAIRLRAQGHDVTILEQRDKPGGRAYVFAQDGFTFDAGPTIITAPWLIDDLFTLCGRRTADYVTLVPIDPYYNVRFEDGSVFRYNGNMDALVEQVRAFNPDDVEGFLKFSASTERIFDTGFALIDKPFHKFGEMLKVAPDLVRLQSHKSVATYVNQFIKDERLRQVFSFHPLLIGGNPFQSTSIYALIHHL
ncbi:MAG: phytoene desaturase family protein, partial [Gemmatimonadota bacterium]